MTIRSAPGSRQDGALPSSPARGPYTDELDFDIAVSEMSDVSPNIKTTAKSCDFQVPAQGSEKTGTMLRLISRPESAGNDTAIFIDKPGPTVLQPGKLSRTKPKAPPENTAHDHHLPLDDERGVAKLQACVAKDSMPDYADSVTRFDDFQVLPVRHSEQSLHRIHQDTHTMLHTSVQDEASKQDEELDHEEVMVTKIIPNETRDAGIPEGQQHDAEHEAETVLGSGDYDRAGNNESPRIQIDCEVSDTQKLGDVPTASHIISPDNNIDRKLSMQPKTKQGSRVQKSRPASTNASTPARDEQAQTRPQLDARRQPSEEDLLYLLMHRARQKKQSVVQDLEQQARLRHENGTLLESRAKLEDALDQALLENHSLVADIQTTQDELDAFKTKYKKLKAWAREVNADFVKLKQDGDQLKTSLVDLQSEHVGTRKRVQEEIKSNSNALEATENIGRSLAETRKSTETLESSLRKTREQLTEKSSEIRTLKVIELQHRSHVHQLYERQDQFEQRSTSHQRQLTDMMNTLGDKLNMETTMTYAATLDECLQHMRKLSEHETTKRDDLKDMNTTMGKLEGILATLQASIDSNMCKFTDLVKPDTVVDAIRVVRDTIESIRPDMIRYQDLRELNARHEETIKNQNTIQQVFEHGQHYAQAREAETLKTNSMLIKQITNRKENDEELCTVLTNALQTKLNELQSWKDANTKELMEAQARILSYQARIDELEQQLEVEQTRHTDDNGETQAKHNQELDALRIECSTKHDQHVAELMRQIKEREEKITSISEILQGQQDEMEIVGQKLSRSLQAEQELAKNLQEAMQDRSRAEADLEKEKAGYCDLHTKYQNIEAQTSAIPNLRMGLEQKANAVSRLQADLEKLSGVDEQLQQVRAELVSQQDLADELQSKLKDVEVTQSQVNLLNTKVTERDKEIATLTGDLAGARQQVCELSRQEKSFKDRHTELVKLQGLLEDAQHQCKRIPELEAHNRVLEQQIKSQKNDLQALGQRADHSDELENTIIQKDKIIAAYENDLLNFQSLRYQLQRIQERRQKKDRIVNVQENELARIESQHSQHSTDEVAEFFTQNTDLSIDTHELSESQETQIASSLVLTNNNDATVDQISGVDPRCIMAATPLDSLRAARPITSNSQGIVIPDSQQSDSGAAGSGLKSNSRNFRINDRTSSPLSDVDEEFLKREAPAYAKDSKRRFRGLHRTENKDDERDNGDSLLPTPPSHPKFKIKQSSNSRPTSAMSQDEMLLSTLESRRQSTSSANHIMRDHTKVNGAPARSESGGNHADKSLLHKPSPRRLRDDVRDQRPVDSASAFVDDTNEQPTQTSLRERNRPNSAVKRRAEQVLTVENSHQQPGKRLKRPNGPLKQFISSSIESISTAADDGAPSSSGTHRIPSSSAPTSSRSSKRMKTTRKTSRQDKYTAQFASSNR